MFSEKRVALALLALLFAAQLFAVAGRLDRAPHADEVEYLHAGWMMANGERLFETFFEHHSPFLFAALAPLAPETERSDVREYVVRARALSGTFGLLAVAAFAAVLWRLQPMAAALAVAALLSTGALWLRIVAEIRFEAFALAFFWVGASLVLLPRGVRAPLAGGFGIALIAIAGLWTPKWPLVSALLFAVWIARLVRAENGRVASIAAATLTTAAALLVMHRLAPLDQTAFFAVELTRQLYADLPQLMRKHFQGRSFLYVTALFKPAAACAAAAIAAVAAYADTPRRGELLFALAFFGAAALELRVVHPYPAIWPQNYAMWCFAVAALLGLVPFAIAAILRRTSLREPFVRLLVRGATGTAFVVLFAYAAPNLDVQRAGDGTYWVAQRAMTERLRPGETVWVETSRNPITVRDAHYYWFGFDSTGPTVAARALLSTPRGARFLPPFANLPLCEALSGRGRVRFVSRPDRFFPAEVRCFDALAASGRLRRSVIPKVYEIDPAARIPPQ